MQSQIQPRQTFISILMALVASVAFSSKAIMVKIGYVYLVNASKLIALRMLFSIPFFMGLILSANYKSRSMKINFADIR
ncbi:MAG: hypothetical protein OR997_07395 [Methylophilaceae bacterium]|nr:hypothetical protein [Methylophilaceae bacterium]|tara:strand:+ start:5420 stop:5656 length:237 start_codon:yes stop_codon:yes gene_type:complete